MRSPQGRVLVIAGSDPSGGAGIQGDIKTITALGGYAMAAITALTAQNTQGVFGIHDVPVDFITQQITLVLDDIGADAIKTGMLNNAAVIEAVASSCGARSVSAGSHAATDPVQPLPPSPRLRRTSRGSQDLPLILDPVMFAKGGAALLKEDALESLKKKLIPLAAIVTPNIPEAEYLSDIKIQDVNTMRRAADAILALGCMAVLIKGGHLEGASVTDLLAWENGIELFTSPRINTKHTHGTGCALASAIATGLAQKMALDKAVRRAQLYVKKSIECAPGLGQGHGPLGHGHTVAPFLI